MPRPHKKRFEWLTDEEASYAKKTLKKYRETRSKTPIPTPETLGPVVTEIYKEMGLRTPKIVINKSPLTPPNTTTEYLYPKPKTRLKEIEEAPSRIIRNFVGGYAIQYLYHQTDLRRLGNLYIAMKDRINEVRRSNEEPHITYNAKYGASRYKLFSQVAVTNAAICEALHRNYKERRIYQGLLNARLFGAAMTKQTFYAAPYPRNVCFDPGTDELHSTIGPAITFEGVPGDPEPLELYYLKGVHFSYTAWKKALNPKVSVDKYLHNMRDRRRVHAIVKTHGAKWALENGYVKLIDKSSRGNELYGVMGYRTGDNPIYVAKYRCPSTGKTHYSFVPNDYDLADHAVMWKYDLSPQTYYAMNES